ncbi:MAG: ECF RNA polymerase sigma factor SigW [Phycisphaerae bacterium]|nr:ECF RNA polymerase sigma factor SigW [Phycisphaerae bacterium]
MHFEDAVDEAALADLIERARRDDPGALAALIEAYGRRVYGFVYRLTGSRDASEDLMQTTFLRLVRMLPGYVHQGKFDAWLFRIAGNAVRDRARAATRRDRHFAHSNELASANRAARDNGDPHARAVSAEDGDRLQAALAELEPADREIVMLRHFSDLSFREIADLLNVPLGTALSRAHRALGRLRARLEPSE